MPFYWIVNMALYGEEAAITEKITVLDGSVIKMLLYAESHLINVKWLSCLRSFEWALVFINFVSAINTVFNCMINW
jgi:hypothetical protein